MTFVQHLRNNDNCLIQLCWISPKLPTLLLFALARSEIHRCWQIKEMEIVLFLLLFNLLVTKVPVNIWYNLHPTNSPGSVVLLPNSYQVDWHFFLLIIQPVWDHFLNELWYCKGANSWQGMISGWGSARNWRDCDTAAFLVAFLALFDISIWHIDCRYIDTFEKYRYRYQYRYGDFGKYRYR